MEVNKKKLPECFVNYGGFQIILQAEPSSFHEPVEPKIRSDAYGQVAPAYLYDSPVVSTTSKSLPLAQGNGHSSREYGVEGQASSANILSQQGRQVHLPLPPINDAFLSNNEDIVLMERKRKVHCTVSDVFCSL